jgi:rod shape-determining protein MreD
VNIAGVVLATIAALVLQATLVRYIDRPAPIDLILIVTVSAGLKAGAVIGLLVGTVGGLVQDALGSGIIGIGAWAKTVVGLLAGIAGTQLIVAKPIPRLIVFVAATLLHAVVFMGLYEALGLRDFEDPFGMVAIQSVSNALVGVVALQVVEYLPAATERRRLARPKLRR